jgi:hypothetical protein
MGGLPGYAQKLSPPSDDLRFFAELALDPLNAGAMAEFLIVKKWFGDEDRMALARNLSSLNLGGFPDDSTGFALDPPGCATCPVEMGSLDRIACYHSCSGTCAAEDYNLFNGLILLPIPILCICLSSRMLSYTGRMDSDRSIGPTSRHT